MQSVSAADVMGLLASRGPDMVSLLERMVEAESPSSEPDAHQLAIAVLQDCLGELDFRVRVLTSASGHRHLLARPRRPVGKTRAQLILGHYDTVWPVGTVARRPFEIEDNVVRGPGVFDMKGGLAQMVLALRVIRELGLELPAEPIVFINSDEEIGSRTSTRHIERLAKQVVRAFVLEPALGETGSLKTERKGIGRFTITVHGKAAHAGLDPDAGASAILELSHVIQRLFALNDSHAGTSVNVGMVDGGMQPNVIAPHSQAVVDVRVPTIAEGERITRLIHSIEPVTPGVRLHIEGGIGRPSMEATPRNRALWRQADAIGKSLGMELTEVRAGGGSDGNTTSQYTATLDGLGPVGHGAHAEHEFLYLDKTLARAALLALLLLAPVEAGKLK